MREFLKVFVLQTLFRARNVTNDICSGYIYKKFAEELIAAAAGAAARSS
jgi:hypothetical protein